MIFVTDTVTAIGPRKDGVILITSGGQNYKFEYHDEEKRDEALEVVYASWEGALGNPDLEAGCEASYVFGIGGYKT